MALKKAANSGHHPALPASDLAADTAKVVQEAEDVAKHAAQQAVATPQKPAEVVAPPPSPTVSAQPSPTPSEALLVGEGRAAGAARRGKTSHRGKKSVLFAWPASEVRQIVQAAKKQRRTYKQVMRETDPDGTFNLTVSNVTATALARALEHPQDWADADHVRNDARRSPQAEREALEDVGLTWPVALIDSLTEAWEDLDAEGEWPAKFTLTKANLALAGIRHEMASLEQWLSTVPNDDRFTTPTDADGRRRAGQAAATTD